MMRLLNRGKEEEKPPEGEIPDEFVMLVAKKLFEKYGDAIAETINKKISQQLEPIRDRVAQMEKEIQYLRATSDEKIKDLLKSTIEVAMESVAEKSAKKAVEHVELKDKVDALDEGIKMLKEVQIEMAEKLDKVEKILSTTEKTLSEVSNVLRDASSVMEDVESALNNTVEQFKTKVNDAVNRAVKQIRENVVVDKGLIESVVSQSLSKIVTSKFKDVESEINGVLSRVDSLSKAVKELKGLEVAINIILEKLGNIEDIIKELPTRSTLETTQQDIAKKFETAKEAQDEEVYEVE